MLCDTVSFFPELSAMHNARKEDPDKQDKSKAQLLFRRIADVGLLALDKGYGWPYLH